MDNERIQQQVARFRKGFGHLDIVSPATPGKGIQILSEEQQEEAIKYARTAEVEGKCKFVPASGAATRMFKDIYAGLEKPNASTERLSKEIEKFPFYDPATFPDGCNAAKVIIEDLGFGAKPKGVLPFHRYADEVRTALQEHLVEGQAYMRNADGTVNLTVTVSQEHEGLFREIVDRVVPEYGKRYGVKYNIRFTYQDPETNTVAVDLDNKPFAKEDGSLLFRPAGHGALIYNLEKVEEELVSIKNIDNVCVERMHPTTYRWKEILMGKALEIRDCTRGYIYALDQLTQMRIRQSDLAFIPGDVVYLDDPYATPECQELCNEIEEFLRTELCIEMPPAKDSRERAEMLRAKLNRPVRVCGMVRNEGEPGGGPFIIRGKDGSTSLQILESAQIDMDNPHAVEAMKSSTHFNPVDLVCCIRDYEGNPFKLTDYVDEETGFISQKSYQGKEIKALELPGLWNGAMSDWNTAFVEVPIETFNPVKVLLDLLRPAHQN